MSVDSATGEVTLIVTDSSLRGTFTDQKVQISLPSYSHNLGEASLTFNVLTCEDLTLTLPTVSPFTPLSHTYTTFDLQVSVNMPTDASLVLWNYPITCGAYQFVWKQTFAGVESAIDSSVFTYESSARTVNIYSEDGTKAGNYMLSYTVTLDSYPSVVSANSADAFSVNIIDLCTSAQGLQI